jgi:hypothetical protein
MVVGPSRALALEREFVEFSQCHWENRNWRLPCHPAIAVSAAWAKKGESTTMSAMSDTLPNFVT